MVSQMGTRPAQYSAMERPCHVQRLRRNIRGRRGMTPKGFFGSGTLAPKTPPPQNTGDSRRQQLFKYVQEVQQDSVAQFLDQNQGLVADAMKQTVQQYVGKLPCYFDVMISGDGGALSELMLSAILTAYMMRNALYRMELQSSIQPVQSSLTPMHITTGIASPVTAQDSASVKRAAIAGWTEADSNGDAAAPATVALAPASLSDQEAAVSGGDLVQPDFLCDATFAPGVQKTKVQGEVLRWHLQDERLVAMPAADYMTLLEEELMAAREQLRQLSQARNTLPVAMPNSGSSAINSGSGATGPHGMVVAGPMRPAPAGTMAAAAAAALSRLMPWGPKSLAGSLATTNANVTYNGAVGFSGRGNPLLEYMNNLPPHCRQSLTSASKDIVDAMHAFVARLMGTNDPARLRDLRSEFSAEDVSKVLMWLMVVGFTLRSMEARFDMEDAWQLPFPPASGGGLLPGNFNMLFPSSLNE